MHTPAEYRQYAQECMDSARTERSDATRMQFLELAKLWLTAAVKAESMARQPQLAASSLSR
jgi:hypothetical protein